MPHSQNHGIIPLFGTTVAQGNFLLRTSNFFVLSGSGYALELFVLTPYRSPQNKSFQHVYNVKYAAARNIVERTIGLLKIRFRCFQGTLQYDPQFVCKKSITSFPESLGELLFFCFYLLHFLMVA